jgi:hypothetical protein
MNFLWLLIAFLIVAVLASSDGGDGEGGDYD